MRDKKCIRARALEARRTLPQAIRKEEEARLAECFFSHIDLRGAPNVGGYSPTQYEIDCGTILKKLRERNCKILLPSCQNRQQPLQFRIWDEKTPLVDGKYGISEPPPTAERAEPDILIVPLLAFDHCGTRVGYGGGYYDRTLHALRARQSILALGLAFANQRVDGIPAEPSDEALDCVITGSGMTWFNESHVRRLPIQ